MRFWQKAFLAILVLFVLSINICLYLTSKYSFSLNMQQETQLAMGEYQFISNGIYENLNSLLYRQQNPPTASSIENMMSSFANYYATQEIYLELKDSNKLLFSNIPDGAKFNLNASQSTNSTYTMKILSRNGAHYLYIGGQIREPNKDYTFTYVRNLSELYANHAQLIHYLILVTTMIETLLALALLLVLRKLTSPIRLLQKATRKIAGGVYSERIRITGKDEFYDLAENFNLMALSIQEKINELDKNVNEKQRLIDNLAHELKTPLTAIRGYAEYLQSAHAHEENRIKATGYIIGASDRMTDLVHKILDLALARNSLLYLHEIHPSELLGQVETLTAAKLGEKHIKLEVYCALEDKLVGDSVLLQSLLINLIDNAAKASDHDSIIKLSTYFDSAPVFEVKDYGCGMEEEHLSLICDPFYRVDKARSRSSGGIGLGLSLCAEIVKLHQAELRISSQPGKGTTVQIVFTTPLQPPDNFETSTNI